jgi:hypothetical protein
VTPGPQRVSVCPSCHDPFPNPTNRKYCGDACREAAHEARQRAFRRAAFAAVPNEMTDQEIAEFITKLPPFDPDRDFDLPDDTKEEAT